MRGWAGAVALVFCLVVTPVPAAAQDYLPGIAEIESRGEIRVGMIKHDIAPMVTTDEAGNPAGYDAEIAATIARLLEVKLTIVRTAETYDDVIDQVAHGDVDIGVSYLTRTAKRAKRVLFTKPYVDQHVGALVNRVYAARDPGSCPSEDMFIKDVPDATIGVAPGSTYAARLKSIPGNDTVVPFDDVDAMMKALQDGDIDIALQGEVLARQYMIENPDMRLYAILCDLAGWPDEIAIAVNRDVAGLVPFLNVVLDHVRVTADDEAISLEIDPWF